MTPGLSAEFRAREPAAAPAALRVLPEAVSTSQAARLFAGPSGPACDLSVDFEPYRGTATNGVNCAVSGPQQR